MAVHAYDVAFGDFSSKLIRLQAGCHEHGDRRALVTEMIELENCSIRFSAFAAGMRSEVALDNFASDYAPPGPSPMRLRAM